LHQVVTARDQTILVPIENPARKSNGFLKIIGEEKKSGGSSTAAFKLTG